MFGYVEINKLELKVKDYNRYHAYYCGLCRSLKSKYGFSGQITLTYDMTFLIILLTGLYELKPKKEIHSCVMHPGSKHITLSNEITDYGADMNFLLSYYNLMDDWADEHKILPLSLAKLMQVKCKKVEEKYPRQAKTIKKYMKKLSISERRKEDNLDKVAGFTGNLVGELFIWKEDIWSNILHNMGFYLGKFIYLMDAYVDKEKDIKKSNYNPWKSTIQKEDFEENAKQILTMMMAECSKEFEKLPIFVNLDILRNILYSGVWVKYNIIQQKKDNKQRSKEK